MSPDESSNLSYKGYRSVTFFLVMFGYISGTALLVGGFIDAPTWASVVFGMLGGYIVRDGVSKIAETYWQKKIADSKPEGAPPNG